MTDDYKDDATMKLMLTEIADELDINVTGCEKDTLVFHYSDFVNPTHYQYEIISRARKGLILIMDSKYFNKFENYFGLWVPNIFGIRLPNTFYRVMKELRDHSKSCKNDTCKEHGWSKTKVLEVVEVCQEEKSCSVS